MDGINRADIPSPSTSSSHARRQRLLESWPISISRHIPRWIPYLILRVVENIITAAAHLYLIPVLIYIEYFGTTDIWGVERDRAQERRVARRWKQFHKEEKYWKPTPLKLPRNRRLSLPLEERKFQKVSWWSWNRTTEKAPQQNFDQLQSPLGRLPEELRNIIYSHVVAGSRLHVQESYKRFGCVECTSSSNGPGMTTTCDQLLLCLKTHLNLMTGRSGLRKWTGNRMGLSSYNNLRMKPDMREGIANSRPREMLSLAKTCRLFYTGYISYLYSRTTFAFTSIKQFHTFSSTIPSHHLNKITSLQFSSEFCTSSYTLLDLGWKEDEWSQWKSAWELIATMDQLRVLRVDLRMTQLDISAESSSTRPFKSIEENLFEPMRNPQQTSVFEVTVNWMESKEFVLGEAPFKLKRVYENLAWTDIASGRRL